MFLLFQHETWLCYFTMELASTFAPPRNRLSAKRRKMSRQSILGCCRSPSSSTISCSGFATSGDNFSSFTLQVAMTHPMAMASEPVLQGERWIPATGVPFSSGMST
ncbi:hypothetical protein ACSQ67_011561 [Phaseolus vulgaris]